MMMMMMMMSTTLAEILSKHAQATGANVPT